MVDDNGGRVTWVLVDGENIDATLGASILGRRPQPDERPRWDRLIAFTQRVWGQSARGVFFLNASSGIPTTFVQALKAMDFVVVPLSGSPDEKVVDIAIQRTLQALVERSADVMLVSHDGDFLEDLTSLVSTGRRVGIAAFTEFRNVGLREPRRRRAVRPRIRRARVRLRAAAHPRDPDRRVRPGDVPRLSG